VKAGLPKITLHGLRHNFASILLWRGVDIAVVSKLLGHTSVAFTADIYADLIADVARRAVEGVSLSIPRKATAHTPA